MADCAGAGGQADLVDAGVKRATRRVRPAAEQIDQWRGKHPALEHAIDLIRQSLGLLLIVRCKYDGLFEFIAQLQDQAFQFMRGLFVQMGKRFIEDQHLRREDQGARDGHLLRLAARERARMTPGQGRAAKHSHDLMRPLRAADFIDLP